MFVSADLLPTCYPNAWRVAASRALGRLAQIEQDDLLAQLADGLGQRAWASEAMIGGPRRASCGASDSLRHNISNYLIKKTNILAQEVQVRHYWRNGEAPRYDP